MNINLTLIGQTITFIIFLWFCMKFVWPPIVNSLNERKTRIADGLAAAEAGQREREEAEQRAEEELRGAKEQAAEILAQARQRGDELVDQSKQDARTEGERLLNSAKSEIEQELNRTREGLRKEVVQIALAGTEQLLGKEVDQASHNKLLDDLAAQL